MNRGLKGIALLAATYAALAGAPKANAALMLSTPQGSGDPITYNIGDLTEANWDLTAFNDTGESIDEIRLYNVFSLTEPTAGTLPTNWSLATPDDLGGGLWNLVFSTVTPPSYLGDGTSNIFEFNTYRPPELPELTLGPLTGQGRAGGLGYVPGETNFPEPSQGAPWTGPTGYDSGIPEPTTAFLLLAGGAALATRRPERKELYQE